MKGRFSPEFLVGAFALAGMGIIVWMSTNINSSGRLRENSNTYHAYFESVSGLVEKVPVEVAGIQSGVVDRIELVNNKARLTLRVKKHVKVYENAQVFIRDRGVLGDRFVILDPGQPPAPLLADGGDILDTSAQGGFEQVAESLAETSDVIRELLKSDNPQGALGKTFINIRDTTDKLNELMGEQQERIGRILENIESFTHSMDAITTENRQNINSLLASLRDVSESLKASMDEGGNLKHATEKLDSTLTSLDSIVKKVERGEGTVGKLLNEDTTVDNLNEAIEGVNYGLGLFRRTQLKVRYRGEFLTTVNSLQNLLDIEIAPTPDKFLLVGIVDSPNGLTRVVDTEVSSGGQVLSSTRTVQTEDSIKFSIQLAKRLWNATFRVGWIQQQGGLGIDYHLLKDRLVLSMEAFHFSRTGNAPRLRGYGTLVLYRNLLLSGGLNDALNENGSIEPFVSVGLQFTNNDLKAIMSVFFNNF